MDQRTSGTDIPIGTTRASELNDGRSSQNIKEKAREIGQKASERAQSAMSEQKERATSELGAVAFALRDAATRLDGENMMSGRLIRSAAERLDDFSRRLETRDINGIMWETRNWARRNPAAFIGAAVAVGFIASRFLKASEEDRNMGWHGEYDDAFSPYEAVDRDYRVSGDDITTGTGISTPSGTTFNPGPGRGSAGGGGNDGRA